ncbi:MAG: cell division septation protein DedD [Myxococcota bacterium]|jgi:cell division septation protein DedD
MAEKSRSAKRASSPNWLASLMGAVFLISAGFMLGLVVGVVKEEPELVMGHLAGQSEEVRWSQTEGDYASPDVAAGGPNFEPAGAVDTGAYEEPAAYDARPAYEPAYEAPIVEEQVETVQAAPTRRPQPAAQASSGRTGFSVQVGAFAESEGANRVAEDLRGKGFPVYVTPSAGSRDGRWRVRVGPLATRTEADAAALQLKTEQRLPTWVLSEGGS